MGNLKAVANERVENLSLGMQKKTDIICAIAHDPSVLFIDEPMHGVEPSLQSEIWALIKFLHKNRTIIISSHPCVELESVSIIYQDGGLSVQFKKKSGRKRTHIPIIIE